MEAQMEIEIEKDPEETRSLKGIWMGMENLSEEQRDEINIVAGDIMSLCSQRRGLLDSLTPEASVWKLRRLGEGQGEGEIQVRRFAKRDYTTPVQGQEVEMASFFNILLQEVSHDMEDLIHHMMSMAYLVVKPGGATLSSYMADESVNSASRLMQACKELYEDTDDNVQAEEEQTSTILDLHDKFLKEPWNYENELALLVTEQEVKAYEQEVEKKKKKAEELHQQSMAHVKQWEQRQKQRDRYEKEKGKGNVEEYELRWAKAKEKEKEEKKKKLKEQEKENEKEKATMEYLNKGVQVSKELFALHRKGWETGWGSKSVRCGGFRDTSKQKHAS